MTLTDDITAALIRMHRRLTGARLSEIEQPGMAAEMQAIIDAMPRLTVRKPRKNGAAVEAETPA